MSCGFKTSAYVRKGSWLTTITRRLVGAPLDELCLLHDCIELDSARVSNDVVTWVTLRGRVYLYEEVFQACLGLVMVARLNC